jgi:hypothetical protein
MAPTLHPDDPRFRHRFAATRLERLNLELAAGHVVPVDIAAERFAGELLALRGALFGLRHSFTETDLAAPDFPKKLATAIGEALVINLTIDDPKSWPAPGPLPTAPSAPDFTVRDETVYSPRYPDSDPRHAAASQKADATDAALTAFRAAHETLTKVLDLALFHCSEIRARLGEIPARLSPDADDIAETLSEEIIAALRDLSESPADVLRRRMREVRCEVLNPPARFG